MKFSKMAVVGLVLAFAALFLFAPDAKAQCYSSYSYSSPSYSYYRAPSYSYYSTPSYYSSPSYYYPSYYSTSYAPAYYRESRVVVEPSLLTPNVAAAPAGLSAGGSDVQQLGQIVKDLLLRQQLTQALTGGAGVATPATTLPAPAYLQAPAQPALTAEEVNLFRQFLRGAQQGAPPAPPAPPAQPQQQSQRSQY